MATHGFTSLPVVSREEPARFLGMVRRDDMLTAYRLALTKQTEYRQRIEQLRVDHPNDITFADIRLHVGHTVAELGAQLPHDSILVSVQHGGHVLIPHGDTMLHAGDKITAFTRRNGEETLRTIIRDGARNG